jgi:hypothetical protein
VRYLTILAAFVLAAFVLASGASTASAQETAEPDEPAVTAEPFSFGSEPGWHLLGGLSAGGGFGTLGGGVFTGLELSVSRLMRRFWWGGYLDATYDFVQQGALATAGPQIGYAAFGLDGGIATRIDTGDNAGRFDYGPQARLLVTAGLLGIYGRYVYLVDHDEHIGQAGILLKLPLWAD